MGQGAAARSTGQVGDACLQLQALSMLSAVVQDMKVVSSRKWKRPGFGHQHHACSMPQQLHGVASATPASLRLLCSVPACAVHPVV